MGVSGKRIIQAIIQGQIDAKKLSQLADPRVKSSKEDIENSLEGQWKDEQLFVLKDCFEAYEILQKRIKQIDKKIKEILDVHAKYDLPSEKKLIKKQNHKNQINIGLKKLSYAYYGVDLLAIPNVSYNLVMTIISELGHGYDKFSTSKEFRSYLRLAPNNKISGGKKISGRVPKGKNPLAIAFRNAANTISGKKSGTLVSFFKRKAYQKGRGAAITATARKLATIVWHMLNYKEEYMPMSDEEYNDKIRNKVISNMKYKMRRLGIDISELKAA